MSVSIVSPLALWDGFDPAADELHITRVREYDDGFTVRRAMYYDGCRKGESTVRAYCEFSYTHAAHERAGGYLPVIVVAADMFSEGAKNAVWQLHNGGYAVMSIDYRAGGNATHTTIYPDAFAFARLEEAKPTLYLVNGDPHDTAWYVWGVMTRRAIGVLDAIDEADVSRIGVLGIRDGGNIVLGLAALEDRIRSCAVIGNTGWHGYHRLYDTDRADQIGFFDDQTAAYNYMLSPECYAPFIKKPVMLAFGTNDPDNDFDRAFDTYARFPDRIKTSLTVSPRADGAIRFRQLNNMLAWFDNTVRYDGYYPDAPAMEGYVSSGRQYMRLTAEDSDRIADVAIYYAYNEKNHEIRNWYLADAEEMGEGQWIVQIPVTDADKYVFCFGTVTYDNGVVVATQQVACKPIDNGVVAARMIPSRLVYEGAMGTDCFSAVQTGGLYDYREELEIKTGPLGIRGIQARVGRLATYKLADPRFCGYEDDMLTVNFYAPETCLATFRFEGEDGREYSYLYDAAGGDLWQKLSLLPADFKDEAGLSPKDWDELRLFSVERERGKTFLIASMLWA